MTDDLKSELNPAFTFSQSSLQDYFDCARRFQLRYIEHLSWPAIETEPLLENERRVKEGQLYHRMVQQYLVGISEPKLSRLANSPELSRWWGNFLDYNFSINGYAQYPELTLTAPLGSHHLIAKYDLVAILPGQKAIIYDWKTYHKRPKNEWMAARMQTRVYRYLLVQAGTYLNGGIPFQPDQVEMIYWYAEFPSDPSSLPYQTSQYQRDSDVLSRMVAEIDDQRLFPLTDDEKKCAFCPYRSYCDRGEKAGKPEDLEPELEAEAAEFNLNIEQIAEIEF